MNPSEFLFTLLERLGWALLHSLWQGAAVVAFLVVGLVLARRRSAAFRHALYLAALVAMPVCVATTFALTASPKKFTPKVSMAERAGTLATPADLIQQPAVAFEPTVKASVGKLPSPAASTAQTTNVARRRLTALLPALSALWAVGVAFLSVRRFAAWRSLRHLQKRATSARDSAQEILAHLQPKFRLRRPVRLIESLEAVTPMVVGFFKPVILFPAQALSGLRPEEVESILAHELAHVARRDSWSNLTQIVAETLCFYHPAVWWMGRRTREEREMAADDLALKVCSDSRVYVGALLRLAETEMGSRLALAAQGGDLLARARRILQPSATEPTAAGWGLPGILVVTMAFALGVARVKAEDSKIIKVHAGQSLQVAIDAAPEGAVIQLDEGAWKERVLISKPLTLEGSGWGETSIAPDGPPSDSTPEARADFQKRLNDRGLRVDAERLRAEWIEKFERPALRIRGASGVTVRRLRVSDGADAASTYQDSLVILRHGQAVFEECAFVGPAQNGVVVTDHSDVEIRRSLAAAFWHNGITVAGRAAENAPASRLHLVDSEVRNAYYCGIALGTDCNSTIIEHSRISGSAWHGIRYDNASPKIAGNAIFSNARCGIYASGETAATVRDNLFWKNEMDGVSCWSENNDTISGNTFADNLREGLLVLGNSKPQVSRNLFAGHPAAIVRSGEARRDGTESAVGAPILDENGFWNNKQNLNVKADPQEAPDGNKVIDPQFRDADYADFSMKPDSPARLAKIGAADVLAPTASKWPLLPEEKAMIPESESRDFSGWKKPGAAKKPAPAAGAAGR